MAMTFPNPVKIMFNLRQYGTAQTSAITKTLHQEDLQPNESANNNRRQLLPPRVAPTAPMGARRSNGRKGRDTGVLSRPRGSYVASGACYELCLLLTFLELYSLGSSYITDKSRLNRDQTSSSSTSSASLATLSRSASSILEVERHNNPSYLLPRRPHSPPNKPQLTAPFPSGVNPSSSRNPRPSKRRRVSNPTYASPYLQALGSPRVGHNTSAGVTAKERGQPIGESSCSDLNENVPAPMSAPTVGLTAFPPISRAGGGDATASTRSQTAALPVIGQGSFGKSASEPQRSSVVVEPSHLVSNEEPSRPQTVRAATRETSSPSVHVKGEDTSRQLSFDMALPARPSLPPKPSTSTVTGPNVCVKEAEHMNSSPPPALSLPSKLWVPPKLPASAIAALEPKAEGPGASLLSSTRSLPPPPQARCAQPRPVKRRRPDAPPIVRPHNLQQPTIKWYSSFATRAQPIPVPSRSSSGMKTSNPPSPSNLTVHRTASMPINRVKEEEAVAPPASSMPSPPKSSLPPKLSTAAPLIPVRVKTEDTDSSVPSHRPAKPQALPPSPRANITDAPVDAPKPIKRELPDPSEVIIPQRKLVTESCSFYPIPDDCRKSVPGYKDNRVAFFRKEYKRLRSFGLTKRRVIFR